MSQVPIRQNGIGGLNGVWEKLFKFVVSITAFTLPCLVGLNIWYVQQAFEGREEDSRQNQRIEYLLARQTITVTEANLAHLQLKTELIDLVTARFPPPWLLERVENNKIQTNRNSTEIDRLKRNIPEVKKEDIE